ncbi:MAG: hypothetical protein ACRD3S_17560 [Terracidiphilus sp.]
MINTKLVLIIAAAIAVIVAGYFAIRAPEAPPVTPAAINPLPAAPSAPSPQYLHDHPAELADAKAKCNQGTAPPDPFCTNVRKAEELVEVDEYSKAVGGGAKPK